MNTQENNKLIAEFLGKDHELNQCIAAPDFHKSWDWLMPVVEKIESVSEGFKWMEYASSLSLSYVEWISYTFQIENKSVTIWKHSDRFDSKRIIEINGNTKREATYNAIVEFIKQLNK